MNATIVHSDLGDLWKAIRGFRGVYKAFAATNPRLPSQNTIADHDSSKGGAGSPGNIVTTSYDKRSITGAPSRGAPSTGMSEPRITRRHVSSPPRGKYVNQYG